MKATKFFSILSVTLLFFTVISVSAGNPGTKRDRIPLNPVVHHQVNLALTTEHNTCNMYVVEILNGNGQQVAPPKPYRPGVTSYDFYERGPVTGVRIAVFILAPAYSRFSCETEYFTAPATITGTFLPGETYRYELFPQTQPNKK